MIRKISLITGCFIVSFNASAADFSKLNPFFEIGVGSSKPVSKLDSGIVSESSNYTKRKSIDSSTIYRTAVGVSINENLRVSLEHLYGGSYKYSNMVYGEFTNVSNNFKVKHQTNLLNAYYNIDPINGIKPYVGIGVGVSQNKVSGTNYVDSDNAVLYYAKGKKTNSFAWGFTAGASYDITKSVYLDLSYKYLDLGSVRGNGVTGVSGNTANITSVSGKLKTNTVMLSVGIKF